MLDELQPNIVKAHVRDNLAVLFLQFRDEVAGSVFLPQLAKLMKSAKTHLEEVEAFKSNNTAGTLYIGLGLTRAGYEMIGVDQSRWPSNPAFARGMAADETQEILTDPDSSEWEPHYQRTIHAVVLVGDADAAAVQAGVAEVRRLFSDSVTELGSEIGVSRRNDVGEGVEHFGYVDGRSQPLFLTEDIQAELASGGGAVEWDPAFPLGRVLVPDPAAPDSSVHFGSYFVFRKLEQNVRLFQQSEADLAAGLGLTDTARAGAMIVGRFRNGTPLTTATRATPGPVANNFDYDDDLAGAKCPFQAHIRKTNPRGSGGAPGAEPAERTRLMARRGMTYGDRTDDPNDASPPGDRPTAGVGLLFMAFNADLENQFEFTQSIWANNPIFPIAPKTTPGLDLVIGQGPRDHTLWPTIWGDPTSLKTPGNGGIVPQAVTMKGGEYFFMPSLAFLRGL